MISTQPGRSEPPGAAPPLRSPAEQLATLPVDIQEQLLRVVRLTVGMSESEKKFAGYLFVETARVAVDVAELAGEDTSPGAEIVTTCAQIVVLAHSHAQPTKSEAS